MHIVAKVQGFLPPTHTRHWLPLYPAPWEENTLGMNCAWLPTGWMLPLCAVRGGPGGCGWFLSRPYLATVTFVIFRKKKKKSFLYSLLWQGLISSVMYSSHLNVFALLTCTMWCCSMVKMDLMVKIALMSKTLILLIQSEKFHLSLIRTYIYWDSCQYPLLFLHIK